MPRRSDLHRVMVIGSGPIVIGQAAEFDYAGTQACQALREEGLEVVLLNSNPATIMTDAEVADRVYLEPLTVEQAAAVIARERPQGLLAGLGGQVGLNLAVALHDAGVLQRYGVELLGTPLLGIRQAEDRELFRETMRRIGEPVPASAIVHSLEDAEAFAEGIGFPLIVRPAYTLGGSGGGFAHDAGTLREVVRRGLRSSPIGQCLVERSVYGWKEIEYEVMRDAAGNCITVCNMENLDPVGVHTGDSVVVAPSQTLSDRDYQRLRAAALRIIDALGIAGGCNVQFAADPASDRYVVIEVNPRVSRSSALASKATGYPIAKVAAKIAVGLVLDEIRNPVTGTTFAFFEPSLDYVVLKIPRWPFDKFRTAERGLGTQMKATGEVMAIDRTFNGALQKAIRSLDAGLDGCELSGAAEMSGEELNRLLSPGDDRRLLLLCEALRRGMAVPAIAGQTSIDPWFLRHLQRLVDLEAEARTAGPSLLTDAEALRRLKAQGFSDQRLAALLGVPAERVRHARAEQGVLPVYKMVDTCAAEFEAATPYFYSCYDREDESRAGGDRPRVVVLGSGPIRIGQGIEFDYGSVHAAWALREAGYAAVIVNNNPETVSTDWSTADRLYFEPLTLEDVLHVVAVERPLGVVAQFGGQTAINLAAPLAAEGVRILGTGPEGIDMAEDRGQFDAMLERLGIPRPAGGAATSLAEAQAVAARVAFPVLVRPSYVLGGRAMEICYTAADLEEYVRGAVRVSPEHPILVDRYVGGREVEVDAVSDGEQVLIAGILEHVERAGVHSGDSIAVYPPRSLTPADIASIERYTLEMARALGVRGLLNVQYVLAGPDAVGGGGVHVLEVNPRASRTVPFLTKVTGVPLTRVATRVILGGTLRAQGFAGPVDRPANPGYVAVKMPVFSWSKLTGVDTALGPEMKSTGEVMGIGPTYADALMKGFAACGTSLPPKRATALVMIADRDKADALPLLRGLHRLGMRLLATAGTHALLAADGIPSEPVKKLDEGEPNCLDAIREGRVHVVLNTLTRGRRAERDGFRVRRAAAELGVPCFTSLDTAAAWVLALRAAAARGDTPPEAWPLQEWRAQAAGDGRTA